MRCNSGKIRVYQENEGGRFKIQKYVPEVVGYRICSGCPCGQRTEGNEMNHEIFLIREKHSSYQELCFSFQLWMWLKCFVNCKVTLFFITPLCTCRRDTHLLCTCPFSLRQQHLLSTFCRLSLSTELCFWVLQKEYFKKKFQPLLGTCLFTLGKWLKILRGTQD